MPELVKSAFGSLLKQYRRAANLTQEGLAERAGISARSVSDLERGLSRMPHPDTVTLLAHALSLTGTQHAEFLAAARSQQPSPVSPLELPPLPIALSPIIAREREEASLFHLLQRDSIRFLTLTGPAGVGKTRLSFQIAQTAQEYFTDGVAFVSLEAIREPQLVLPRIAQTLGLQEKNHKDALQTLVAALHDRHLLLILDNCEQVPGAAGSVLELLTRCLHLKVLTTSRARWRVRGEQVFPLAPLSVPDLTTPGPPELFEQFGAVSLFLHCVRAIQPDFHLTASQAPVVAALCVRLDGLPLAIELAAARFPLFSPQQFLERLDGASGSGALHLLTGQLAHGTERHQSLRAAMSWSYELLNEKERRLFRHLSVFAGNVSLEAILAVCAHPGEEESVILDALETLLAQSLVQRIAQEEIRFRLLETVRAYGLEQLAAAGEEPQLRAAYASYMLALAKRETQRLTGAEQAKVLVQLSREMDNFRAALRWFQEHDELEQGLQLAGALWRFWFLQGALSEGRDWLERLLALEEQGNGIQSLTRARACHGAGVLAAEQGDYARALELGDQCSQIAESLGEQLLQAQSLNLQGNVAKYQGAFAQAARYFEASLALFRVLQEHANVAIVLNNLATLAQERGDYAQARTLQQESLALKRSQGNQRGIAVTLMNLGDIARDEGQLAEARGRAEESLRIFEQLSDEKGCAFALNNLGEAAFLQGDYELATTCIQDSLKRSERIGDHWTMAVALRNAGFLALARGDRDAAHRAFQQSFQVYASERSQLGMVECLEGLISLYVISDPMRAAHLYGLTSSWRTRTETPLPPVDAPPLEQAVASLRAALGEDGFVEAVASGEGMSLEEGGWG